MMMKKRDCSIEIGNIGTKKYNVIAMLVEVM